MAATVSDAESMIRVAHETQKVLMVGHTFLFNPAVRAIKGYIDEGRLGKIRYLYFQRTGLGPIRQLVEDVGWFLRRLRNRRDGRMIHYSLDDAHVRLLLDLSVKLRFNLPAG